jgi:hypothetical protein
MKKGNKRRKREEIRRLKRIEFEPKKSKDRRKYAEG